MMKLLSGLALLASLAPTGARADNKFANQFVQFELPAKWACQLEGAEWVCQSTDQGRRKDAIIILAAKLKGDQDSLDQYYDYLSKSKLFISLDQKQVRSVPKYVKTVKLSEHPWVDSLHLESEVPGFYTRYLATIKQDIAVLVTYSINKDKYQEYLNEFEAMVGTLKVFRKGHLNQASQTGSIFEQVNIPSNVSPSTVFPDGNGADKTASTAPQDDGSFWIILLLAGVVVGYVIWKRRQG